MPRSPGFSQGVLQFLLLPFPPCFLIGCFPIQGNLSLLNVFHRLVVSLFGLLKRRLRSRDRFLAAFSLLLLSHFLLAFLPLPSLCLLRVGQRGLAISFSIG